MTLNKYVLFLLVMWGTSVSASPLVNRIEESLSENKTESNDLEVQWKILRKAFDQSLKGQAVSIAATSENPGELTFLKKTLLAHDMLLNNQAIKALEYLEALPESPDIALSQGPTFFRRVYAFALETKKKALEKLGRDRQNETELLWALFPDFESPSASASPPAGTHPGSYVSRVHVLFSLKEWAPISEMISDIDRVNMASLSSADQCQLSYEWAEAQRQLKNQALASKGFGKVVSLDCQGEQLSRSLYWKAKYESIAKKFGAAIKTYEQYLRLFPNHRYTDDAYFALSNLYEKEGSGSKAQAALNKLMGLSKGDMKAKMLWEEGYEKYKKKQYVKAIEKFEQIIAMSGGNDEYQPQAQYWKARSLDQQGKAAAAKPIYQRLANDYPFSFYGVLGKHRAGVSMPAIPARKMSSPAGGLLSLVDALNKQGHHEEALQALDYFAQTNKDRAHKDLGLMAAKYLDSGAYYRAMMLAHDYFGSQPSSAIFDKGHEMIAALFPLAYSTSVSEAAKASGLPKGVIEGIMREESLFQPEIQSHAGAKGLMQLMPATAAMQAGASGVGGFSTSRLSEPDLNITLGADFFAKMVRDFDGQIPLAIMAYNAGPGNVRKWLRSNGHLPLDEFVEEIPFSETRGYIKRVLRSMQVYGLLHNEEKLKKPFVSFKIKI